MLEGLVRVLDEVEYKDDCIMYNASGCSSIDKVKVSLAILFC